MAKHQAAQKQQQKPARDESPSTGTMARGGAARGAEQQTGERDETYDLISVIYHSLQGADTVSKYIGDAKRSGDNDIADFLQEAQRSYRQLAQRGKALLRERLDASGVTAEAMDEEEDEEEDES